MTKFLVVDYKNLKHAKDIWDNGKCTSGYANFYYLFNGPCITYTEDKYSRWSLVQQPVAPEQLVWWGEDDQEV